MFKSLKVSNKNECFGKFIAFPDGSDFYLIVFLIAHCADTVSIVCWIKVSTFIISVLFVAWPPGVEAICAFFGLSLVILLVWDCSKICISIFRFSISLSLRLGSCLFLEVLLDGDFPWLCGHLFRFNVFSFLRSDWDSFSALVLLDLWVILSLVLVLLVSFTTLAYVNLFHMKIIASVTKSLQQDCDLCYLHLPSFFLYMHSPLMQENKVVVIAVFLSKLDCRPLLNDICYKTTLV